MKKYCKAIVNIVITVIVLLLCIFLLPWLLAFFAPFVVGWIIAWMAGPPVKFFEEKMKIKRRAGSAFVIILVIALIVFAVYGLGSILIRESIGLAQSFPEIWGEVQKAINELGERLNKVYESLPEGARGNIDNAMLQLKTYAGEFLGKLSSPTIAAVGNFAKYLPTLLIGVIMTLLSSYLFVADRKKINEWCKTHVPKVMQDRYQLIRRSLVQAVGGYVKAQFKIEIWVYVVLVVGFWILKVKYLLLIALGIAFLDFLPFFGAGAVMIPWAIVKIVGGDYEKAVGILIIWGLGQLLRQLIQPKIVGDSVGVAPLPTLFLLYVGFQLGGVMGMIIAVPVGLIFFSLYEGGVFDVTINSIKLLTSGINNFRHFSAEDLQEISGEVAEEDMDKEITEITDK